MPLNEILSLAAVIIMSLAFWSSRLYLESNFVFVLQIIGYLLWAASSWVIGVRAAVLAFSVCAVTLVLKIFRKNEPQIMLPFLVLTLVGGLIVNNSGWLGVLPLFAAMVVVYVRPFILFSNKTQTSERKYGIMESVMKDETIPDEQRGIRSDQGSGKKNRRQECQQTAACIDAAI